MSGFNPNVAHIIGKNGEVFQELNEDGSDWQEQITKEKYDEFLENQIKSVGFLESLAFWKI